eukprot:scaffold237029_cov66-Attheya_sp.AAC.1
MGGRVGMPGGTNGDAASIMGGEGWKRVVAIVASSVVTGVVSLVGFKWLYKSLGSSNGVLTTTVGSSGVVGAGAPWTVGRTGSIGSVGEVGAMVVRLAAATNCTSSGHWNKVQKAKRQLCRAFYVGNLGGS